MKKTISKFALRLISYCFFISLTFGVDAQCLTPIEAAESCDFLFMLDGQALDAGFCGTLPETNPIPDLTPFCIGLSSSENTGFFLFEPTSPIVTFKITPMNCTEIVVPGQGVFSGMQAAIFEDCTFTEFRACAPTCHPDEFVVGANDFQPFKDYILALDGCNGSICDFQIEVVEGEINGLFPLGEPELNTPEEVCQNDLSEIQVKGLPILTDGNWTVDGDVDFNVRFNGKAIEVIDWGTPGIKTICATITDPNNTTLFYDSCWQVMVRIVPSILSMNESDSLCFEEEIDLTFDATGFDSFSWDWEGGSCNNCPNPVFTMTEEEIEVTLTLTSNGKCPVEQSIVYYPKVGTQCLVNTNTLNLIEVQVVPNPFQSIFEVKVPGEFDLKLYDSQGRLLLRDKGLDQIVIEGSTWAKGLYFLELRDNLGNSSVQKIIKY